MFPRSLSSSRKTAGSVVVGCLSRSCDPRKHKICHYRRNSINVTGRFWLLRIGRNSYYTLDFIFSILSFPLLCPSQPPKTKSKTQNPTEKKPTQNHLGEFSLSLLPGSYSPKECLKLFAFRSSKRKEKTKQKQTWKMALNVLNLDLGGS